MSKKLLMNTNANTQDNYKRYYQEYEGTFITVTDKSEDDTIDTSRFIEVTEIWGNTVQDENNLEDIQSIGELYVDEQGEPILDDLGREQYKIEIESCNKNLLINTTIVSNSTIEVKLNVSCKFKSNTQYIFSVGDVEITKPNGTWSPIIGVKYTDGTIGEVYVSINGNIHFLTNKSKTVDYFYTRNPWSAFGTVYSCQLEESSIKTDYIPHQSHKTTILLPCQLMKVGDVYDRLYWDSEKGRYVVEKNIGKYIDDGTLPTSVVATWESGDYRVLGYKDKNIKLNSNAISTLSKTIIATHTAVTEIQSRFGIDHKYRNYTIKDFNDLAKINNIIYYVPINTPHLIETNITEKILLPCYEEKTHIFVNDSVDATMKVLVPYKEII